MLKFPKFLNFLKVRYKCALHLSNVHYIIIKILCLTVNIYANMNILLMIS